MSGTNEGLQSVRHRISCGTELEGGKLLAFHEHIGKGMLYLIIVQEVARIVPNSVCH